MDLKKYRNKAGMEKLKNTTLHKEKISAKVHFKYGWS